MFKEGNIYNFSRNMSKSVREYITPEGVLCPEILISEICRPDKIMKDGYYKIIKINNECVIKDELGVIRYYDMDIEWERVADTGWQDRMRGIRFFRKLKEMGFYILEKEIEKEHPLDNNMEWFAVDTERGIVARGKTINRIIKDLEIKLIYPSTTTLREIIFQYFDPSKRPDEEWGVGITITRIGPDIFDVMKNYHMVIENAKTKNMFRFEMPFVESDLPHENAICNHAYGPFWGNDFSKQHSNNKIRTYFMKCREVFEEFPKEVQRFLKEYSDIENKYLRGEPWKKYDGFTENKKDYYCIDYYQNDNR